MIKIDAYVDFVTKPNKGIVVMDELAKRFSDLATIYGPNVVNAALDAVRVEAYSSLVGSFMWLGVSLVLLFFANKFNVKWHEEDIDVDSSLGYCLLTVASSIIALGCFVSFVWTWIDPWTWTAINHPELWLAKRVFHI